jgi:hypothetical protein
MNIWYTREDVEVICIIYVAILCCNGGLDKIYGSQSSCASTNTISSFIVSFELIHNIRRKTDGKGGKMFGRIVTDD